VEEGAYSVNADGLGCATESIPTGATVCIKQNGCELAITTVAGTANAVSGTVPIGPAGGFGNGDIQQGTAQRNGCIGFWDQVYMRLHIVCGSMGPACLATNSQCCEVTLTRKSGGC
jgi:hypothetical protein